jgi:hypothetical protein
VKVRDRGQARNTAQIVTLFRAVQPVDGAMDRALHTSGASFAPDVNPTSLASITGPSLRGIDDDARHPTTRAGAPGHSVLTPAEN